MNGQVKYSIVQQPNQRGNKFTVDEETGELFTNKVIDPAELEEIVLTCRIYNDDFDHLTGNILLGNFDPLPTN